MTPSAPSASDDYLIGIDMCTASSKGVLTTPAGEIVASAVRPHSASYPRPGWAEVDADEVWWADVVALCRELVAAAAGARIAGVCVSGVGPCLLLCDGQIRPVRPAMLYGIDMRATAEIAELTERYGADRIVESGSTALSSQAVGPKLLWMRRNEPDAWARSACWYNSNSFAVARLTGEYVLDHHTASQCDPLYDIRRRAWRTDWVEDVAPGLAFPRLVAPAEVVGAVHAAAAAMTGLPEGTPVCAGTVDAWSEAFSAGVRRPGDLMLMWVRELTGSVSFAQLVDEAAATPPGADGLILLPYFAGERTPIFDPDARGVIAGLTLRHGRGHLYRAVYEGIACGIRQILELLDDTGGAARRIVAVGGGTQGGLWTQIVSDVTCREQLVPAEAIGACYGDALLAAVGTGLVEPDTDWARVDTTVVPNPANSAVYEQLFDTYCALYPATRDVVHRLAKQAT